MNAQAMQRFFKECSGDLRRIAYATKGELEVGDVQGTAYEFAVEIANARGSPFDFDAEADRTQLLKWLYARLVKFADKSLRFAVSLDEEPDEDRPTQATMIARGLRAHETSDPALLLERAQEEQEAEEALLFHYSELVAYLFLFRRFDTRKALAAFLRITASTLRRRVRRAEGRSALASLFDGIDTIDPDFVPVIAMGLRTKPSTGTNSCQWEWAF